MVTISHRDSVYLLHSLSVLMRPWPLLPWMMPINLRPHRSSETLALQLLPSLLCGRM
jgi:hypothetical protein